MVNAHSCGTGCASGTEQADSVCSGANTAKMTVLDQSIHSLDWDIESRVAVMSEWDRSKRLGEEALRRLMDLSVQLGRKALLFQQADMEYRSVLSHVNVAYGNAVNMLNVLQSSRSGDILPAHANDVAVVSDPLPLWRLCIGYRIVLHLMVLQPHLFRLHSLSLLHGDSEILLFEREEELNP